MKTARYRKKCFHQIEGIAASNKELTAEVERLRQRLEAANHEKTAQESQNQNLVIQLSNKERERTSK
jgi:regulator of replication initiation timing